MCHDIRSGWCNDDMPAPRDTRRAVKILLLLRLYPRSWRERYGEEFFAHLREQPIDAKAVLNIVQAAIGERIAALFKPDRVVARRLAGAVTRFVMTFAMLIALCACGVLAAFGVATALSAVSFSVSYSAIAVPLLLLMADTFWLDRLLRRRRRAGLPHAGPLGPMTPLRLAATWSIAIGILATAKWIQWHATTSGTSTWMLKSQLDRALATMSFGWPIWLRAIATLHYFKADLIYVQKPPGVPNHPLGLA